MNAPWSLVEPWTEEARSRVAELLVEGLSAGEIAAHFPGRTRNAIVGLVARDRRLSDIGFARSPKGGSSKGRSKPEKQERTISICRPKRKPMVAPDRKPVQIRESHTVARPIFDLPHNRCRFAVNDAGEGEAHLFCGLPSKGSWCEFHRAVVEDSSRKKRQEAA